MTHITDINGQYSLSLPGDLFDPLENFSDDDIVARAYRIMEKRAIALKGEFLESPEAVKNLFRLRHSGLTHETFDVAFLSNRHRLLTIETISTGTIDSCSIYPRRIIERSLRHGAAACIFSHGHPSGEPSPSRADISITEKLKKALAYVDVRVLDHVVTSEGSAISLAERGDM